MKLTLVHPCPVLLVLFLIAVIPASAELTVEQVQKLLPDGEPVWWDRFGDSVSVHGETALIGAPGEAAVYIFTQQNGVWILQSKLSGTSARFGDSVSLSDETALIGAPTDDENGLYSGAAFVLTRRGEMWSQEAKLLADDGAPRDYLGWSVALDGNTAVVVGGGATYVFTSRDGVWSQEAKLEVSGRVSIDGDTIAIGVPSDRGDTGATYVFTREDDGWAVEEKLLADDGYYGFRFGSDVSVSGDSILIGSSTWATPTRKRTGAAYVFTREEAGWLQQARLRAADGYGGDQFGGAVSLDGDTAVIGASFDRDLGAKSGSSYVFSRINGVWSEEAKLLADDGSELWLFGRSVSLDDSVILVGAVYEDEYFGDTTGSTYTFRILRDPIDLLNALADRVRSLTLHHGTENSLLAKLDAALALLTDLVEDNDHAARNVLNAFINQVEAQHGKKVPAEDADGLIEDAQEIIALLVEG